MQTLRAIVITTARVVAAVAIVTAALGALAGAALAFYLDWRERTEDRTP